MKKEWLVKTLALGVVVLFIGVTVTPSIGISSYLDDTIPPVTFISFNPPEPDGKNGWYVSSVTVILNATDDDSGVNITKYRIDGGVWYKYTEPFILDDDGEDILIDFYSIDNAQNVEEVKSVKIDIDKTKPEIRLECELTGGNTKDGYDILFTAYAWDETSGMNRVGFYHNNYLWETVIGPGPTYHSSYHKYPCYYRLKVGGFIRNPEITDEYVKFYAVVVITLEDFNYFLQEKFEAIGFDSAGNVDLWYCNLPEFPSPDLDICLFKNITLPNDYHGYIGKFFIKATFDF